MVNALSSKLNVEIIKNKNIYLQKYSKGKAINNKKFLKVKKSGTSITFTPDVEIFGKELSFDAIKIYEMIKNKAFI